MTQYSQNLLLTILLILATLYMAAKGRGEVALSLVGIIAALWRHSGRDKGEGGPPLSGAVSCIALLLLSACDNGTVALVSIGQPQPGTMQRMLSRGDYGAQAGSNADYLRLTTQASAPSACASPFGCFYMKTADGLGRFRDASGNEYVSGTSWRVRQYAGTPGSVAEGDLWLDTGTHDLNYRSNGGTITLGATGGMVTLATSQTISGTKTFSAAQSFTGDVTLGDASADVVGLKGAVRLYNSGVTFYSAITTGATANRSVVLPDAAGNVVLDSATQTLTNKTIGVSQLSGQVAKANGGTAEDNSTGGTANTFWARPDGATGAATYRAIVAGDLTGLLVYDTVTGGGKGTLGAATGYLVAPGVAWSTTTEPILYVATRAATVRKLYCNLATAPGGGDSVTITVRKGGVDQTLTCPITGAATTCNDTSHSFSTTAGNIVSVKGVSTAGTAADLTCSFEVGN